jgi:hypothetical protein
MNKVILNIPAYREAGNGHCSISILHSPFSVLNSQFSIFLMHITAFPFQTINWTTVPEELHEGETGYALWQIIHVGDIRVRRMVYSPGYKADHWCKKGHIIHCLEGSMITELEDGRHMPLSTGMTYIVGDNCEAHRTFSENGCTLFVVD